MGYALNLHWITGKWDKATMLYCVYLAEPQMRPNFAYYCSLGPTIRSLARTFVFSGMDYGRTIYAHDPCVVKQSNV